MVYIIVKIEIIMKYVNIYHIKQAVIAISGLLVAIGLLSSCEPQKEESIVLSPEVTNWSAELLITGGFAGVHQRLSVNGRGEAQFTDHRTNTQISAILTAKQLYDLANLVKNTPENEAQMGKTPRCNDCFQYGLTFQYQQHSGRRSLMDLTVNQSNASALINYLRQLSSEIAKQKK